MYEVGRLLSHGVIVTREYGVPALVNVNGITQYVHDSQNIIVDGLNVRGHLEARHATEETNLGRQ